MGIKQRVYWNYDSISYWAEEQGADVVLFGHTHRPVYDDRGRVMLFNPGSISMPRGGTPPTSAFLPLRKTAEWKAPSWNITGICLFAD
ncbi:MAG: metallophosphoesterase family protein [Anaerotignum sp.]